MPIGLDPVTVNVLIDKVQKIRAGNNNNWMELIKLALIYAPSEKTIKIINKIVEDDNRVIEKFKELNAILKMEPE